MIPHKRARKVGKLLRANSRLARNRPRHHRPGSETSQTHLPFAEPRGSTRTSRISSCRKLQCKRTSVITKE